VPLVQLLDVDGADAVAIGQEPVDEVSADESSGAGDENGHLGLYLRGGVTVTSGAAHRFRD
jgi:hypothetical protein